MLDRLLPLETGDTVALAAPARTVSPDETAAAISALRSWGYKVLIPEGLYADNHQFAGDDAHRTALLQELLDNPEVRAILCCRGGYGTVRIIDGLDFSRFAEHPKWIIGYSDITVLHSHIHATLGQPTLHAVMPVNFPSDGHPTAATESLRKVLMGEGVDYHWESPVEVAGGTVDLEAEVTGGNLSILYSLLGSPSQVDTRGKILLIEDLDEYLYHIDRMMQALKRAGMLDGIKALLVGGLTDMHDNTIPFGQTVAEIIVSVTAGMGFPVLFGAPFGHLENNNLALPLGTKLHLMVSNSKNCRIFAS